MENMREFEKILLGELPELKCMIDEPMTNHTTFRVGGPADLLVCPNRKELPIILALAKEHQIPVTIIGNGSNLLVSDQGIRGLVIEIGKRMDDIEVEGTHLKAGAGALLSKVAQTAAGASLGGMEFAAGIPGSIGGAIVMNAGAYGGEIKDIIVNATVLDADGNVQKLPKETLDLSYRHSCITDQNYYVVEAEFELCSKPEEEIRSVMAELREKRMEKQPLEYPSAGSTFKRPEGYFAGKLIQDAGLRGYRVGDAQVSEKHCGFVINRGNASAADILQLIHDVQQKVKETFDVTLETEVRILGE